MSLNEINYVSTANSNPSSNGIRPQNNARVNNLNVNHGIFYKPSTGTPGQVLQLDGSGVPTWVTLSASAGFNATSSIEMTLGSATYTVFSTIYTSVPGFAISTTPNANFTANADGSVTVVNSGRYLLIVNSIAALESSLMYHSLFVVSPSGDPRQITPTEASMPGAVVNANTDRSSFASMTQLDVQAGSKIYYAAKVSPGNPQVTLYQYTKFIIVQVQ